MCPQRATAGLRRTTAELTDGNQENGSPGNNVTNFPTPVQPTDPVTMEISSSPPLTDMESLVSWHSHQVGCAGPLSDCLQAELAIVYLDSDAGEDQRAAFALCDVTNQEEAGEGIHDIICDGENKEEKRGENEETGEGSGTEEQGKRRGGRDDDEEQMRSRRDLFLHSPSVSSTASSTDPYRKVGLSLFLFNIMP